MLDSTYRILPGFVHENDPSLKGSVNGWNDMLEKWLLDIQRACNAHYSMLIDTAGSLKKWKWIFLIINMALSFSSALMTAILLPLELGGIWLPIYSSVITVVGAALFVIYEQMDFNGWGFECRNTAGEFIILGRNIESVKRVPRSERERPGLQYTNDASITFETLRANQPAVPAYIKKRYTLEFGNSSSATKHLPALTEMPDDIESQMALADVLDKREKLFLEMDHDDSTTTRRDTETMMVAVDISSPSTTSASASQDDEKDHDEVELRRPSGKPVSLQDLLWQEQMEQQADDELTKYENYVREQYAMAHESARYPPSLVRKPTEGLRKTRITAMRK